MSFARPRNLTIIQFDDDLLELLRRDLQHGHAALELFGYGCSNGDRFVVLVVDYIMNRDGGIAHLFADTDDGVAWGNSSFQLDFYVRRAVCVVPVTLASALEGR